MTLNGCANKLAIHGRSPPCGQVPPVYENRRGPFVPNRNHQARPLLYGISNDRYRQTRSVFRHRYPFGGSRIQRDRARGRRGSDNEGRKHGCSSTEHGFTGCLGVYDVGALVCESLLIAGGPSLQGSTFGFHPAE